MPTKKPSKKTLARRKKAAPKKKKKAPPTPIDSLPYNLPARVKESMVGLTPLKQRFVMYYCGRANGNATLAARLAGVKLGSKGGTSPRQTLKSRGHHLLNDPEVRAAIDLWMEEFSLSSAMITHMMADLARADHGPFITVNNQGVLSVKVLDDEAWEAHKHWIKTIEADPITGRVTKLVLHDRQKALVHLAKIKGLLQPDRHLHLHLYEHLSDEELLAELEKDRQALGEVTPHVEVGTKKKG